MKPNPFSCFRKIILASLLQLLSLTPIAVAQLPDARPSVVRFESDVKAFPQNFAIAADNAGYVYIGNSEGVQVFDGEDWHETKLPNQDLVRSLTHDGDGRIYVGGFDEFGYLEQKPSGEFQYVSLLNMFSEELAGESFADIWYVSATRFGVFFVGLEHLFLYQPETGTKAYWKHEGSLGPIGEFDGRVFLQWRGEGIKSFDGATWTAHPHLALSHDLLTSLLPVGDELIIINNNGPWLGFSDGEFREIPGSETLPYKQSMTHGFVVQNDTIGVATQLGVIVFYNLSTGETETVQVSDGFVGDVVTTGQGHVLSVDDLGFSSLLWPTRWRVVDTRSGLIGSIFAVRTIGDRSYALSSSGVFAANPGNTKFERLSWTTYEAWDLLALDSGDLLFADSYEIKLIAPDGNIQILDNNTSPRLLVQSRFDPDRVYVGTEFGVQILQRGSTGWHSVVNKDDMTNLTVTHIVERAPDQLWIGSSRGGIYRLEVDQKNWQIDATPIGEEQGLHYDKRVSGAYIYDIDGELVASTDKGLFRHNGETFVPYTLGDSGTLLMPGRALELATNHNQYWAFYYDRLFHLDTEGHWQEEEVSHINKGGMMVLEFQDDRLLVTGLGKILVYDPSAAASSRQSLAPVLKLTHAETGGSAGETRRLPLDNVEISTADERLALRYAMTEFERPDTVRYRTKLEPVEKQFSAWTTSGQQSFLNLAPGNYRLSVQSAKNGQQPVTLEVPLTVNPQWFETAIFRVIATLLILALVFALARYAASRRARLLRQENEALELKVAERTRALQSANQQLDRMAHLDGLTEIANRRRLDAYLEDVKQQCAERQRDMAIAIFDVDHFKRYNDTHGHQAGDALLIYLAQLLSRNLRRSEDLVARYGGEEFVVVLPGAGLASAMGVVESMRRDVEQSDLGVTVSAGLHVQTPDGHSTVETMLKRADQALYEAKHSGRNRMVAA